MMIQFTHLLVTAVIVAAITHVAADDQILFQIDNTVLLTNFTDAQRTMEFMATTLVNSTATQDSNFLQATAGLGINAAISDQLFLVEILESLVFRKQTGADMDIADVFLVDVSTQWFFEIVNNKSSVQSAIDCGNAIICERNNVIDQVNRIGNLFNENVTSNAAGWVNLPQMQQQPGVSCDAASNRCQQP